MKLIIQIPCYNEEESLPLTLADLPNKIEGFESVEWLVIDDGSVDRTSQVARENGVHHILKIPFNRGLANAFTSGLREALRLGADVIVNTDADNQYDASYIPDLVQPILDKKADMVVGERPILGIDHFSITKKVLQKLGSKVVRSLSGTDVQDAPSGFRAFNRSAAMRMNVFGMYTYTLETIIQAGQNGFDVISVPIGVNGETRESRLVKSTFSYVKRSATTMIRFFVVYRPLRFFLFLSGTFGLLGLGTCIRYLTYFFQGEGDGHIQSLILGSILLGVSMSLLVVGLLADLISVNRRLLEKTQWKLAQLEDQVKDINTE